MKLITWLNKPYPFITDLKTKILIALSFGLFIYLFLLVFLPFEKEQIIFGKSIYIIGFGLITLFVLLFNYIVLPLLFTYFFNPNSWVIKKEIFFITLCIILIAFLNYEYNLIAEDNVDQQSNLGYFILVTISVGFFPITIFIFVTELYLTNRHQKVASETNLKIHKERETDKHTHSNIIDIKTELKKDKLKIDEEDLVFIKSEDNYCHFFYYDNNEIKTKLLRVTLKDIEKQLGHIPNLIRCHRSYIVNKKQISRISGNARAYYLHFDNCKESAIVSRSFPKEKLV